MTDFIEIDGRQGEGGGQILRTSLSLAAILGRPLVIHHIRGGRKKPGLLRQHLACVRGVAEVTDAKLEGAELRSESLRLEPGTPKAGEYHFSVGSAGSTLLVLQTVLPVLLRAGGASSVTIEGGTHNPMAPAFGFMSESLVPQMRKMGICIDLDLLRPGFNPAGGGKVQARIERGVPQNFSLVTRGEEGRHACHIGYAHLDRSIVEREWRSLQRVLHWTSEHLVVEEMEHSLGPGNVLDVRLNFANVTQVFTQFGAPGVSGKILAQRLGKDVLGALRHTVAVEPHLADQLMLPMALQAGGEYITSRLSSHATTNADVINQFAPGTVDIESPSGSGVKVRVRPLFPE